MKLKLKASYSKRTKYFYSDFYYAFFNKIFGTIYYEPHIDTNIKNFYHCFSKEIDKKLDINKKEEKLKELFIEKVNTVYNIDVSNIVNSNISEIIDYVADHKD
mgnify:CR=1 FL=1